MRFFKPVILAAALLGAAVGVGSFTFAYAKGGSYLKNDPQACANCHVMGDHYASWLKSSHRNVAGCNDCHTPPGTIPKYLNKASNGFRHALAFTTGNFPDAIQITPGNVEVTELACRSCHAQTTDAIDAHAEAGSAQGEGISCLRCHDDVGHWVR